VTGGLQLGPGVERAIRTHGREAYPHECCGALLGHDDVAVEAYALPNTTSEGPRRRFLVSPDDYRSTERRAAERGLTLLGFYHSHPDHPARRGGCATTARPSTKSRSMPWNHSNRWSRGPEALNA
jgi:proteasome lid subunit RPN8/RPN11